MGTMLLVSSARSSSPTPPVSLSDKCPAPNLSVPLYFSSSLSLLLRENGAFSFFSFFSFFVCLCIYLSSSLGTCEPTGVLFTHPRREAAKQGAPDLSLSSFSNFCSLERRTEISDAFSQLSLFFLLSFSGFFGQLGQHGEEVERNLGLKIDRLILDSPLCSAVDALENQPLTACIAKASSWLLSFLFWIISHR